MDIRFTELPDITIKDPLLFTNDIRDRDDVKGLPSLDAFCISIRREFEPSENEKSWEIAARAVAVMVASRRSQASLAPWLYVADAFWRDDNRIVRYKKLWKPLEKGYGLKTEERSDEIEIVRPNEPGIRYVLSCKLNEDNFVAALKSIQNLPGVIILSDRIDMTSEQSVREFFRIAFKLYKGLPYTCISWPALLSYYCPSGDILIGFIRDQDDRFHTFYILGLPERLAMLGSIPNSMSDSTV